jgi:hypothetical protein
MYAYAFPGFLKGEKDTFESIPGDNVSLQAHVRVQIVDLCMVNSIYYHWVHSILL